MKTFLAALALVTLPAIAVAQGCTGTPVSCEAGTIWDPETQSCEPLTA